MVATVGDADDVMTTAIITGITEVVVRCSVRFRDKLFHSLAGMEYESGEMAARRLYVSVNMLLVLIVDVVCVVVSGHMLRLTLCKLNSALLCSWESAIRFSTSTTKTTWFYHLVPLTTVYRIHTHCWCLKLCSTCSASYLNRMCCRFVASIGTYYQYND